MGAVRGTVGLAAAMAVGVSLTACAGVPRRTVVSTVPAASPSTAPSGSVNSSAAPSSPKPSAKTSGITTTKASSAAASCSGLTGEQALEKWLKYSLPPEVRSKLDYSTYDPCAPLSWLAVWQGGASGSSTWDIMLFHAGQFVRLASDEPLGFKPVIARTAPHAMQVTYTYRKGQESNADASGKAISTFTWDERSKKVVHGGEWPPGYVPSDTVPSAKVAVPAGAFPGAGGPLPAGAVKASVISTVDGMAPVAIIRTPSGNIGCDLGGEFAGCGVDSWRKDRPYGPPNDGHNVGKWWMFINGPIPQLIGKPEPGANGMQGQKPQVLGYGQIVYWQDTVCGSAENGITCWSLKTGHGAFISREGYTAF